MPEQYLAPGRLFEWLMERDPLFGLRPEPSSPRSAETWSVALDLARGLPFPFDMDTATTAAEAVQLAPLERTPEAAPAEPAPEVMGPAEAAADVVAPAEAVPTPAASTGPRTPHEMAARLVEIEAAQRGEPRPSSPSPSRAPAP